MTPDYLDTLCLYYEEEIEGEAYFAALATRMAEPHARRCLMLLAAVERHAAEAIAPLIDRYGLLPRSTADLTASGVADAESTNPDWPAFLAEMEASYPGYLDAFRALEAMGPREDQDRLAFLSEHEVVALEFLALERAGAPDSTKPLDRYLAADPDMEVVA